ncbi:MAG: hypothetical protein LGB58_02805, partial [Sulfurovum sp.]|nr:hypothetical protein [Sulfurovum sp.]
MAFASARTDTIGDIGSGEILGNVGVVTTYTEYDDGLEAGKFCFYDATNDKIQIASNGIVAGVVKRNVVGALEDDGAYKTTNSNTVDVIESGLVTVEVVPSTAIVKFGKVYVSKEAATLGKATSETDTTKSIALDGVFY